MSAFLAILGREVARLSGLLAVGLVLGLAALGAPHVGVWDANLAFQFAVTATVVTATVLAGGSALAPDLADRQLGFLFARPVPWWAIWAGRLGAAVVVSLGATLLAALPGLAHGDIAFVPVGWYLSVFLPGVLISIGAAHLVATTYRSRDGWAALDVVFFAGTIAVLVLLELSISAAGGLSFLTGIRPVTGALWTVALVLGAASAAQTARGRSDIVRGRRVASAVVWCGAAAGLLLVGAAADHAIHPRPKDLKRIVRAHAAPAGPWISVSGERRFPGGFANLLFDPSTGRSLGVQDFFGPSFSGDGRRVAWRWHGWRLPRRLAFADLGGDAAPKARAWRWDEDPWLGPLVLSPDGRVAFVSGEARAGLVDVETSRPLAMVAVGQESIGSPVFVGPTTVRALRVASLGFRGTTPGRPIHIIEIGPAGERRLGDLTTGPARLVLWTGGGTRLLVSEGTAEGRRLAMVDGATGGRIAEFAATGGRAAVVLADWLPDGTIVVGLADTAARLLVVRPDGSVVRTIALPPWEGRFSLAAVAPDVVAVTTSSKSPRTLLVDVRSGTVLREEAGLAVQNAMNVQWFETSHALRPLFLADGALVELDLATGARHRLLPLP